MPRLFAAGRIPARRSPTTASETDAMNQTVNPWTRWEALYLSGELTWADLLEITGLSPMDLYAALDRRGCIPN